MGTADAVPGVSGGTVALILGIYERLVTAISRFDTTLLGRRQWAQAAAHVDLRFLATLFCGIMIGLGGLATVMRYLLENQRGPTLAVFFGLILASSLLVARSIGRWRPPLAAWALAGAVFAFWLVGQPFMSGREGYPYLFLCGVIAICAMILPGISGSFILWIMGKYKYMIGVVSGLVHGQFTWDNIAALLVFGCGAGIGLLGFSKFLRWLLARYHPQTMAVLCGFMAGSLRCLWPFQATVAGAGPEQYCNVRPGSLREVVVALLLAAVAAAFVLALDWLSRRHQQAGKPSTEG